MTYEEVVKEAQKIVAKGDASRIKDHLAVQYNISSSRRSRLPVTSQPI